MKISMHFCRPVCAVLIIALFGHIGSAFSADAAKPTFAPKEPRKQRSFKAPEGFKGTVYAEPPDVLYPVCLTAMPDGSLFVGIDQNGSLDKEAKRGSIIVSRDLNQDGRADSFLAFVADIDSPRGLVWDGDWLYVLHPPNLTAFRDTDGDGVADETRELIEGIGFDLGFRGADHTSNGIQMGIDGWIYVAIGDYGFKKAVGTDGRTLVLRGGGIVRVRPDGTGLEQVSRGQRNIYDVAVSPLLERFTRDNTNDGGGWDVRLSHIVDMANYGYPSLFKNFNEEIMPPLADYGGGSPCGSLWIQETTLPEPWNNTLFTVEWGRSRVFAHPLKDKGAGYEAGQEEFVTISRPTDIDVDASGRIYISSWEGGQYTYKGPDVGWMLELRPDNWKPVTLPDLKKADEAVLLTELSNPGTVRRFHAQRELLRRDVSKGTQAKLLKLAARTESSLEMRVAALFTASQAGVSARQLQSLASDASLRRFVIRSLGDGGVKDADQIDTDWFVSALGDADPKVKREALIALAHLNRTEAAGAVFALQTSDDRVLSHTARKAFVKLAQPGPAIAALSSADSAGFHAAQMALREMHRKDVVEGLEKALVTTPNPERRIPLLTTLVRLYYHEDIWRSQWWGTRPDTVGPYYDRGAWSETPRIEAFLTNELANASSEIAVPLLQQLVKHRVEFNELLPFLVGRALENPDLQEVAVDALWRQQRVPNFAGVFLESILANEKNSAAMRAKAIGALDKSVNQDRGASRAYSHLVTWPLDVPKPLWDARRAFLTSNKRFSNVDRYIRLAEEGSPGDKALAYAILANAARRDRNADRSASAKAFVAKAQETDTLLPHLLRGIGLAELRADAELVQTSTNHKDESIRTAAAWASEHAAPRNRRGPRRPQGKPISETSLEDVMTVLKQRKGNANFGKMLFERQACNTCHTVDAKEPVRGPYLGDIAKRYDRDEIAMSILRPSATIAQGFESQWFLMNDEREIQGFVVNESGDEVRIRDVAGNEMKLIKAEIEKREKRDLSIMPEGMTDNLTPGGLASLIAYLQQLSKP